MAAAHTNESPTNHNAEFLFDKTGERPETGLS